jgi:hypothetical protein
MTGKAGVAINLSIAYCRPAPPDHRAATREISPDEASLSLNFND